MCTRDEKQWARAVQWPFEASAACRVSLLSARSVQQHDAALHSLYTAAFVDMYVCMYISIYTHRTMRALDCDVPHTKWERSSVPASMETNDLGDASSQPAGSYTRRASKQSQNWVRQSAKDDGSPILPAHGCGASSLIDHVVRGDVWVCGLNAIASGSSSTDPRVKRPTGCRRLSRHLRWRIERHAVIIRRGRQCSSDGSSSCSNGCMEER